MPLILKVPTHLDGRNPIVGRYTAREVVPVVAAVFAAAGVMAQPRVTLAVRLVEVLALVPLGVAVGLVRPSGRSLLAWGRLAVVHRSGARSFAWAPLPALTSRAADAPPSDVLRPPHLPAATDGHARAPIPAPVPEASESVQRISRRPATQNRPFVPTDIADDVIAFADGHRCAVLECSGANVEAMDPERKRALHDAYHAFLLGLSFPVQMLICADPVDLDAYAARRATRLAGQPLAVRRLGSEDAAYMRRTMARLGALDQRAYVVIPDTVSPATSAPSGSGPLALARHIGRARRRGERGGSAVDPVGAGRILEERCEAIRTGLAGIGVQAWRLDTPALRDLYYRRLCPRTARLQLFDAAHASQIGAARVTFDQPAGVEDISEGGHAIDELELDEDEEGER